MTIKKRVFGFGFVPDETLHHFEVTIPSSRAENVYISENYTWEDQSRSSEITFASGNQESSLRVVLSRIKWNAIADSLKEEFNRRLRNLNLKVSKWETGYNYVSRLLGKELAVLAWAIEDADPLLIPVAVKNWQGLAPEERWWLYTMANAATGHALTGRNKGWRKAIRFALTENPITPGDFGLEQRKNLLLMMEEESERLSQAKKPTPHKPKKNNENLGTNDTFIPTTSNETSTFMDLISSSHNKKTTNMAEDEIHESK